MLIINYNFLGFFVVIGVGVIDFNNTFSSGEGGARESYLRQQLSWAASQQEGSLRTQGEITFVAAKRRNTADRYSATTSAVKFVRREVLGRLGTSVPLAELRYDKRVIRPIHPGLPGLGRENSPYVEVILREGSGDSVKEIIQNAESVFGQYAWIDSHFADDNTSARLEVRYGPSKFSYVDPATKKETSVAFFRHNYVLVDKAPTDGSGAATGMRRTDSVDSQDLDNKTSAPAAAGGGAASQ